MVIFNSDAEDDLVSILYGLLTWEKHIIELEHARSYLSNIREECYSINGKTYHFLKQRIPSSNFTVQKFTLTSAINKHIGT